MKVDRIEYYVGYSAVIHEENEFVGTVPDVGDRVVIDGNDLEVLLVKYAIVRDEDTHTIARVKVNEVR